LQLSSWRRALQAEPAKWDGDKGVTSHKAVQNEVLPVVVEAELQLVDGLIGGANRVGAVSSEIVRGMIQVLSGSPKRSNRFSNFGVGGRRGSRRGGRLRGLC
jgi:hypothetical protein